MTSNCLGAMLMIGSILSVLASTEVRAMDDFNDHFNDHRSLWSQEWEDSTIPEVESGFEKTLERRIPFIFGIAYEGQAPKALNSERFFSLASVKKVITAATALRELGSSFRFSNEFTGTFDESEQTLFSPAFALSGDPTWAHESYGETLTTRMLRVIDELKRRNIRKVKGEIKVYSLRASVEQFSRPKEWKKDWLLKCYAALPTTVSMNGNCAFLSIHPKKVAWSTIGVSTPVETHLTHSKYNALSVLPELDSQGRVSKYIVRGGLKTPITIALPVHRNEGWLTHLFKQELARAGIVYEASEGQPSLSRSSAFYVDLSSAPLKDILVPFLQESINLVGDRLHIEAPGDFITLASLIPDSSAYEGTSLVDGSGLMATNKITPKAMLLFMKGLVTQPYFQDLYDGLPVSGQSGTLRGRMGGELKGRIHAKTGTINGVANLAGYLTKSDQSLEPFVIFTESGEAPTSARAKIDAEVAAFARKN